MSSNVNFDTNGAGPAPRSSPDPAAWLDACAAACRQAGQRISEWGESGARYFKDRRMEEIAADLTALARERPGQTLAVAALLGALVGGAIYRLSRPR